MEEKKAPKPTLVRVVSSLNCITSVSSVSSVSSETIKEVHFDENAKKEN